VRITPPPHFSKKIPPVGESYQLVDQTNNYELRKYIPGLRLRKITTIPPSKFVPAFFPTIIATFACRRVARLVCAVKLISLRSVIEFITWNSPQTSHIQDEECQGVGTTEPGRFRKRPGEAHSGSRDHARRSHSTQEPTQSKPVVGHLRLSTAADTPSRGRDSDKGREHAREGPKDPEG
jgi:hypothetical protein